jgi:hypothetical protein
MFDRLANRLYRYTGYSLPDRKEQGMSVAPSPLELYLTALSPAGRERVDLPDPVQPPRRGALGRLRPRRAAASSLASGGAADLAARAVADEVTIRRARERDLVEVVRLGQLDGRQLPAGERLIAEAGGRTVAAVDVATGAAVIDPVVPTCDVVSLLRLRAAQLREAPAPAAG